MQTIHITASREYDCLLGSGVLDRAGDLIRSDLVSRRGAASARKCRRICVVSDQNVSALYGQEDHALIRSLKSAGFEIRRFVFPGGEAHKNLQTVEALLDHLSENRFTRSDILAALGGGITGDITGFAAAVYQRGIEFVQIPTSLLAAVDSSIGGKTGVNLKAGKNLAGAFWQPNLVLFDPAVLATLSEELLLDGMAEILKAGFITDESLLQDALALIGGPQKQDCPALIGSPQKQDGPALTGSPQKQDGPARSLKACEPDAFVPLIGRAIDIKRKIVEEDERESGSRKLLNLGHTFAHAIEKLSGYTISHGAAVAMGTAMIAKAADGLGWSEPGCADKIREVLSQFDFRLDCPFPADRLAEAARGDKKAGGTSITLVIPAAFGRCVLKDIPLDDLEQIITKGL